MFSLYLPILAHFINIWTNSCHFINIFLIWMFEARALINMNTTCFHSLENVCFEPLLRLGSIYKIVELCHNVCSSLWDSNLWWRLHYHLLLDYFVKLQHVVSSCSSPTCCHYVMFHGRTSNNHDDRTTPHCITINFSTSRTVSKNFYFIIVMVSESWWYLVCMFWIYFQNVSASFDLFLL